MGAGAAETIFIFFRPFAPICAHLRTEAHFSGRLLSAGGLHPFSLAWGARAGQAPCLPAGGMPAPRYSGLNTGIGGGCRGTGAGPRWRAKRGSLGSRSSGGRAANGTFMGVMYIYDTQMSIGQFAFFCGGRWGGWARAGRGRRGWRPKGSLPRSIWARPRARTSAYTRHRRGALHPLSRPKPASHCESERTMSWLDPVSARGSHGDQGLIPIRRSRIFCAFSE